jgi:hypothetical protein
MKIHFFISLSDDAYDVIVVNSCIHHRVPPRTVMVPACCHLEFAVAGISFTNLMTPISSLACNFRMIIDIYRHFTTFQ